MGVRKDLDARALPPDALSDSSNVIVLDGSLRPRPRLDPIDLDFNIKTLNEFTTGNIFNFGLRPVAGPLMVPRYVNGGGNNLFYSYDGETWTGVNVGGAGGNAYAVFWNPVEKLLFLNIVSGLYKAPATWPVSGSWTNVGAVAASLLYSCPCDNSGRMLATCQNDNNLYFCEDATAEPLVWSTITLASGVRVAEFGISNWVVGANGGGFYYAPEQAGLVAGDFTSVAGESSNVLALKHLGNGIFIAVDVVGRVFRSADDGESWSQIDDIDSTSGYKPGMLAVDIYTQQYLVNIEGVLYLSPDGATPSWTEIGDVGSANACLAAYNGRWIIADLDTVYSIPITPRPLGIVEWESDQEPHRLVVGTDHGWLHVDQANDELVDLAPLDNGLTGTQYSQVVFRTFEMYGKTFLLGVNGVDVPKAWDGATEYYRDIDGEPPRASCMAVAHNRVIMCRGQKVYCSSHNNFDAGWNTELEVVLGDSPGKIIGAMEIDRLNVVLYKTDAIYHAVAQAEFYGVSSPFRFEAIDVGASGPCSPNSIVRMPDGSQVFLARDGGIYIYDGVRPKDAGPHVRAHIQPYLYDDDYLTACGCFDTAKQILWFWFSDGSNQTRGVALYTGVYPWTVWPVDLPWSCTVAAQIMLRTPQTFGDLAGSTIEDYAGRSLESFSDVELHLLQLMSHCGIYMQDWDEASSLYQDGTTDIDTYWVSGWEDFGEPWQYKTAQEIQHLVDLADDEQLDTKIAVSDVGQDSQASYAGPYSMTNATRGQVVGLRATGRSHKTRYDIQAGRLFSWRGALLALKRRGRR